MHELDSVNPAGASRSSGRGSVRSLGTSGRFDLICFFLCFFFCVEEEEDDF